MTRLTLQKALQAAGVDSRRNIRRFIHDGRFKVNQAVVNDPNFPVDISRDTIWLDNKRVNLKEEQKSYFIFNKPDGVISTLHDPEGRPTIKEFITKIKERVYPVGRLDFHSEGLILLTNDGELTNFIISPRNKVAKQYRIKIKGTLKQEEVDKLKTRGMVVDGTRVKPLAVDFIKKTAQNNSWWRITIFEGKKHVLRKMFQYTGHPVQSLKRTAIGTIRLKKLPRGHWRELTKEEIAQFKQTHHYPQHPF